MSAFALVALGANLPHQDLSGPALLRAAIESLAAAGWRIKARSSVWESAPWPPSDQPPYHNAVIAAAPPADAAPEAVLAALLETEQAFGRVRREKWGPRTLDLDLIDLDGLVREGPAPVLPHPRAHERAFVLAPLAEAAPAWRHPVLGLGAGALLAALPPGQKLLRTEAL